MNNASSPAKKNGINKKYLKIGTFSITMTVVVIAVVPSLLIAMLGSLLKTSGVPMPSAEVLQAILYSSPLFTFAVFLISFRISVRICQKKEY